MEVCGLMGPLGDVRLALHVSRGTMFLHPTGPKTAWKHTDPGDILILLKGLIVSLGYSRVRDLTNITPTSPYLHLIELIWKLLTMWWCVSERTVRIHATIRTGEMRGDTIT